jgi:hypothetical protein
MGIGDIQSSLVWVTLPFHLLLVQHSKLILLERFLMFCGQGCQREFWEATMERESSKEWTVDDINLYLASQLVMGLTPEPSIEDYFKHDERGIFGSLWMQETFSRDKWTNMNQNIHFEPKLCMSQLRSNIQGAWNLGQVLVVDEMMRTFTGRWRHIQHIKGKPHDTGLKFYGMTDRSFYLWDFWLYQGEEFERQHSPTEIVLDFARNAIKDSYKCHIMVADSYYGSLQLAMKLNEMKLGCLLSCKSDRPAFLFSNYLHNGLSKGEWSYVNNRHFSAITYFDKARVNLISNVFKINKTVSSNVGNKKLPAGIYWYRNWLGGLDHFDRWLHLYLHHHRNFKWTQVLLSTLLKIAVNNTNIIANSLGIEADLKSTTLEVIDWLKGSYSVRKDSQRPPHQRKKVGYGHFPSEVAKPSDCVYCKSKQRRSKTTFICLICKVHLHPKCWVEYHEG